MYHQLNHKLLQKNKVTQEQQDKLQALYDELFDLLQASKLDKTLKDYEARVKELENLEYKLQENWNFPKDKQWHSYWWKLPQCTCPKLDNRERLGTGYQIVTLSCPYHGSSNKGVQNGI